MTNEWKTITLQARLDVAADEIERLRESRNLAYGLLWSMQPIDRTNHNDDVACQARGALLATMTKDDQSAGIVAVRAALK
jgi:hypothetical protein